MLKNTTTLTVRRTEWITPRMVRVVFNVPDPGGFPDTPYTDRYVRLLFPRPGVDYPEPFDIKTIWAELPRECWPLTRTYTVRELDPVAGELTMDFVQHDDVGLAARWAATARRGDQLRVAGPGGVYRPDPAAAWHLLVGDESALPAIGAACERMPAGAKVVAVIEVADSAERQRLITPADLDVTWLHRDGAAVGSGVLGALREMELHAGSPHAFVHGEAHMVAQVRRHLIGERGFPRSALSASGYWRRGRDEEGWRADKAAAATVGMDAIEITDHPRGLSVG